MLNKRAPTQFDFGPCLVKFSNAACINTPVSLQNTSLA